LKIQVKQRAADLISRGGAKKSLRKKILISGAVVLALIVIGLNVYRVANQGVVGVSVASVSEEHLVEKVPASGIVEAADREIVMSAVMGSVKNIQVKMGDNVKAGQVLMELNVPNGELKLAQARGNLAQAKAALSQAGSGGQTAEVSAAEYAFIQAENTYIQDKKNLERTQALLAEGAVSQLEMEQAQASFKRSEAAYVKAKADLQRAKSAAPLQLQSLQAAVETARLQLEALEKQIGKGLLAPRDGQILSIAVKPGDQITEGSRLLTIGSLSALNIQADVTESEAAKIKAGQEVVISGNAFQGKKFKGKVTEVGKELISKVINNQMDTVLPITVRVEEAADLFSGANVDLEITTADHQGLVVPIEALIEEEDSQRIYVVKDGLARLVEVTTGISDGLTIEILSGVEKGDRVVLNPPDELQDGSKVKIR